MLVMNARSTWNTSRRWLSLAVLLYLPVGCVDTRERLEPLPFVVRVNEIRIAEDPNRVAGEETFGRSRTIPARFVDPGALTRALAASLREVGLFTDVVTSAPDETSTHKQPEVDLELDITIEGDDFGPGTPTVGGSVFSTIVWLVAGPASWFIENRHYPDSNLDMEVRLRRAGQSNDLFTDRLPLKGLQLNMLERAHVGHWFLNIIIPPWWGDGDSSRAGENLEKRVLGHFVTEEPDRISARLPTEHFDQAGCFLVYAPENDQVIIVSRESLRKVEISHSGVTPRTLLVEDLAQQRVPEDDELRIARVSRYTSQRALGIGASREEQFYEIPLRADERGLVRVRAVMTTGTGQWSIRRSPASRAPLEVATGRP